MADPPTIPAPRYTLTEALSVCLAMCHRALTEVRALSRMPGPPGETGPEGQRGLQGERGEPGACGEPGTVGPVGPAGRDGVDGLPGPVGAVGELGPQGPPGVAGERGEDGAPGIAKPWRHRRNYNPAQDYAEGDCVMHDGGSWLALCDEPGPLPGDGWAQLTIRGQRGKPGDRGERGLQGPEGRGIRDVFLNDNDELIVEFTDGVQRSIVSLVTAVTR